jgi:hypothetical protein
MPDLIHHHSRPDIDAIVREANAARARFLAEALRDVARGLRRGLARLTRVFRAPEPRRAAVAVATRGR